MNLAGLWASWRDTERDEELRSCTIITTSANAMMRPLHDRMPVILDDDLVERWLDPDLSDATELQEMLRPYPDQDLSAYPISDLVNSPKNQGPHLVDPVRPLRKAS